MRRAARWASDDGFFVASSRAFLTCRLSCVGIPRLLSRVCCGCWRSRERELGGIAYVCGRAQNAVLLRAGAAALTEARARFQASKQTVQHFDAFAYAAETWSQGRHVVMKAEVSEQGANPRVVVTSLPEFAPALLSQAYCERGQCENFIKDCKNALQADRLSCSTFAANFFRLLEHATAYVLFHALRTQVVPLAPQLGRAQFDTLRLQLLKVAALVSQSTRRVLVRLPFAFPLARLFRQSRAGPRGAPRLVLRVIWAPPHREMVLFSPSPWASAGRSSSEFHSSSLRGPAYVLVFFVPDFHYSLFVIIWPLLVLHHTSSSLRSLLMNNPG